MAPVARALSRKLADQKLPSANAPLASRSCRKVPPSILTIANRKCMGNRGVTRIIFLTFLEPDIVQRIVKSDHAADLNLVVN